MWLTLCARTGRGRTPRGSTRPTTAGPWSCQWPGIRVYRETLPAKTPCPPPGAPAACSAPTGCAPKTSQPWSPICAQAERSGQPCARTSSRRRWDGRGPCRRSPELPITHHVLDLDRNFDQLWPGFSSAARRAIRKAEKEHVTIEECYGRAAVLEFYRLYEGWIDQRARTRSIPLPVARRMGRTNEPLPRLLTLSHALGRRSPYGLPDSTGGHRRHDHGRARRDRTIVASHEQP